MIAMKNIILVALTIILFTACTPVSNNVPVERRKTQIENSNESKETSLVESKNPTSNNVSTDKKQTPSEEDVVGNGGELSEEKSVFHPFGWWENSPGGADRLADTYVFREDGTFTFYYNEHFFSRRETEFSGTWEWREDTLFLTKSKKRVIAGGKLVPFSISLDHYMIEDGEVQIVDINPPEEITLIISKYSDNIDGFYNYPSVFLNDKQYWRIYDSTLTHMDEY